MRTPYISTGAFKTRDLEIIFRTCVEYGIHHLELSSGLAYRPDIVELVKRYHGRPMSYVVHNYFPPPADPFVINLASRDAERSLAHCKAAIDLCTDLEIPVYSTHAGIAMDPKPDKLGHPLIEFPIFPLEEAFRNAAVNFRTLGKYAAYRGIRVLIENNVIAPFNLIDGANTFALGATDDDVLELLNAIDLPNVGLLADVGHINVTAQTFGLDRREFLRRMEPHIGWFDLSDNEGIEDTNRVFDRNAWFMGTVRKVTDAVLVIEAYKLEPTEILACRDALASALADC